MHTAKSPNPLVSIIVITYNSANYVLETLESVQAQSYENIELIITDDGSADDTVAICQKWLAGNEKRFVNAELITVKKNTGTPANCNRGLMAAQGEWLKFIAGDDALLADCIKINIDFVNQNPEVEVLQTKSDVYEYSFAQQNYLNTLPSTKEVSSFYKASAGEQYHALFIKNCITAPSIFLNKKVIEDIGGFDEDFKLFEDVPLWLKLTKAGHKIHFLNRSTVKYRRTYTVVNGKYKPYENSARAKEFVLLAKKFSEGQSLLQIFKLRLRLRLLIMLDLFGLNNQSFFSKCLYALVWKISV